uniref:CUB_2 domain-containing protein n=1 Tax=Caenorhabditis tropicalis TaxID=1561998 RepID=A0A1I7U287_9PELO
MTTHFLLLLVALFSSLNAEFVCPPDHITKDGGLSGVIPAGATDQVKIPAGVDCTYTFDIPKGFALKMEISTVYDVSPGDSVMFDYYYISSSPDKQLEFAMNTSVPFEVQSVTGNLTFMAAYTYMDLSAYQQVLKPTGMPFNATLEPSKYYTVQASTVADQVHLKYGSRDTGFVDFTVADVFVFDGPDITNSQYMGNVMRLFRHYYEFFSTKNTLTLINLYGNPSDSLFLGNDASVTENYDSYGVYVMDSDKDLDGWMYPTQDPEYKPDGYYTVICNGCNSFSIDYMMFDKRFENKSGNVGIQGMTPTDRLPTILSYPYSASNNNSFPQLITAPMATFHVHDVGIHFHLTPGTQQQDFSTSPGKTRSIYSPQLWDPSATPAFDYTFSDPLKVYNFSINLATLGLENDGDQLDVTVGSVNGLMTLDKNYTKTKLTNEFISGIGRFLKLKYSGSKTSEVILNFEMIDTEGTTESPLSSSSIPPSVSTRATRVSTAPVTVASSSPSTAVSSNAPSSTSTPSTSISTPKVSAAQTSTTSTSSSVVTTSSAGSSPQSTDTVPTTHTPTSSTSAERVTTSTPATSTASTTKNSSTTVYMTSTVQSTTIKSMTSTKVPPRVSTVLPTTFGPTRAQSTEPLTISKLVQMSTTSSFSPQPVATTSTARPATSTELTTSKNPPATLQSSHVPRLPTSGSPPSKQPTIETRATRAPSDLTNGTTPGYVETTTAGAASLLPTGLLILVILAF